MSTRDEFEKWLAINFPRSLTGRYEVVGNDNYMDLGVQMLWRAWQASCLAGRESMREQLAVIFNDTDPEVSELIRAIPLEAKP